VLIEEIISGANTAFSMYPGLAHGASEVIESFGTHEQKELFCTRMYSGAWGGTMCLTEPHAGSDVGASRTTAKKNADGSYAITGTKIFISGGDHDLTNNIVHLVLARVDGAPAGTKGLTLFIVPKVRASTDGTLGESNDVSVGAIEHKMGINGSSTCVLNFGENGKCIGWPVGGDAKLNQGMSQMFKMMNGARIGVGVQGISVASSAFLNALEYAKDRKQGASIEHWKDATAPRAHHRARRRAPHAARHEVARGRDSRARHQAHAPPGLGARAHRQGRHAGGVPPGAGRPARAAREGVRE
jgi:hypothetical protein